MTAEAAVDLAVAGAAAASAADAASNSPYPVFAFIKSKRSFSGVEICFLIPIPDIGEN
jgi:hypothetical protein